MRNNIIYLISLCLFLLAACEKTPEVKNNRHDLAPNELKVMSFNVREPADGGKDEWAVRAGAVMQMFDDQFPTLVGFQEASHKYINKYLHAIMPQHGYVFLDDPEPQNSVAYRPEVLNLVKTGVMWLSETPSIPSVSPSGYVRTARWMVFEIIATGTQFFYVNTHFDLSTAQQKQNVKLIRTLISQQNKDGLPMVLTGDFNVESDTGVFDTMTDTFVCTRDIAPITDHEYTYNAWGNQGKQRIIDHVFITRDIECSEYKTVTQSYDGHIYVSDHYPVYSIIKLQ